MHRNVDNQDTLSCIEIKERENQANYFVSALWLPAESFVATVTSSSLFHFIELKNIGMCQLLLCYVDA